MSGREFAGVAPGPVPGAIAGRKMAGAKNFRSQELWAKAKLLVLQRVNQDAHLRSVKAETEAVGGKAMLVATVQPVFM